MFSHKITTLTEMNRHVNRDRHVGSKEAGNPHSISVGNPPGKSSLGRHSHGSEDDIKMELNEIICGYMNRMSPAADKLHGEVVLISIRSHYNNLYVLNAIHCLQMTVIAAASECIAASKPSTTLQLCLPCKCLIRLDLVVRSRSSQGLVYLWPVGGLLLTVEAL